MGYYASHDARLIVLPDSLDALREVLRYTGVSETLIMAGLIAWLLIALGTLALYGRYMSNRRGSRR